MAINNQLNVWDSSKTNYSTSSTLSQTSQTQNGFASGDYLSSATFNGILLELSLVSKSLIDALGSVNSTGIPSSATNINNEMSASTLSTTIKNILNGLLLVNLKGGSTGSIPYQTSSNNTTFLAKGISNYVLIQGNNAPIWTAQSSLSVGNSEKLNNKTLTMTYNDGVLTINFS